MSLYDFFFPEQASASHLRRMANQQDRQARMNRIQEQSQSNIEDRVTELENDLGMVTLVLASLLEAANNNGAVSREDIKKIIDELDVLDGFRDGRLHPGFLRKWSR